MKKLLSIVVGSGALIILSATSALAQSNIPPGGDEVVKGDVVTPPGGTAFTGANVTLWMVLAVALLAIGLVMFFAGRRRGKVAAH